MATSTSGFHYHRSAHKHKSYRALFSAGILSLKNYLVFRVPQDLDHAGQPICSSEGQLEDLAHSQGQHDLQYGGPELRLDVLLLLEQLDEFEVPPLLPVTITKVRAESSVAGILFKGSKKDYSSEVPTLKQLQQLMLLNSPVCCKQYRLLTQSAFVDLTRQPALLGSGLLAF